MGKVQGEGWECWDRAVQVAGAGVGAFQAEGTANKGLRPELERLANARTHHRENEGRKLRAIH